jgi:uncharacterized membrane protein YkgB
MGLKQYVFLIEKLKGNRQNMEKETYKKMARSGVIISIVGMLGVIFSSEISAIGICGSVMVWGLYIVNNALNTIKAVTLLKFN